MAGRRASLALVACASGVVLYNAGRKYFYKVDLSRNAAGNLGEPRVKRHVPGVNRVFFQQLLKLFKVSIPSLISKEFALLTLHTATLLSRSLLSIYIAEIDGRIAKAIVEMNKTDFIALAIKFLLVAIPASFINSLIRFLESKLALAIRTQLVRHAYDLYFQNQTYYRVSNLDSRLANPDHSLTEDLQAFSSAVTHIYSQVSKPLLDVIIVTAALTRLSMRRQESRFYPILSAFAVVGLTAWALKFFSPPLGKLVADKAKKSGFLRYVHSRLITNAEEVAFYGGHQVCVCGGRGVHMCCVCMCVYCIVCDIDVCGVVCILQHASEGHQLFFQKPTPEINRSCVI